MNWQAMTKHMSNGADRVVAPVKAGLTYPEMVTIASNFAVTSSCMTILDRTCGEATNEKL